LEIVGHFIIAENYHMAIALLENAEQQIRPYTSCACGHPYCSCKVKPDMSSAVYDNTPSMKDCCKHYQAIAVRYKRDKLLHIPNGLVYEMFRTTAVSPVVSNPEEYDWYNHAVVHCTLYLYYLRFLCYHALGRHAHRQVALDNMIWASREIAEWPGTHVETNHNIIGYCYTTIGEVQKAYKQYLKSLTFTKYHNAALWHLAVLLRRKIRHRDVSK